MIGNWASAESMIDSCQLGSPRRRMPRIEVPSSISGKIAMKA